MLQNSFNTKFQDYTRGVAEVLLRLVAYGLQYKVAGLHRSVAAVLQECKKYCRSVAGMLQVCYRVVTVVLQGFYTCVKWILQECYRGVIGVL